MPGGQQQFALPLILFNMLKTVHGTLYRCGYIFIYFRLAKENIYPLFLLIPAHVHAVSAINLNVVRCFERHLREDLRGSQYCFHEEVIKQFSCIATLVIFPKQFQRLSKNSCKLGQVM